MKNNAGWNRNISKRQLTNGVKEFTYWAVIVVVLWLFGTNLVQAFKCPSMTNTQLFLHLPKTVMLDFQYEDDKLNK